MSWEIYQKDSFLDYLGSSSNLVALLDLHNDTIDEFVDKANTPEGVPADLVKATINELSKHDEWD